MALLAMMGCGGSSRVDAVLAPGFVDGGPDANPTPPGLQLAVGRDTACVIEPDGKLLCWGANGVGQAGVGTTQPEVVAPSVVDAGRSYRRVAVGDQVACAVSADTALRCWGQLQMPRPEGGGARGLHLTPIDIATETGWEEVSVGGDSVCAIRAGGAMTCWDLAGTQEQDRTVRFAEVALGYYGGVARDTDGAVYVATYDPGAPIRFERSPASGPARRIAKSVFGAFSVRADGSLEFRHREGSISTDARPPGYVEVSAWYTRCALDVEGVAHCQPAKWRAEGPLDLSQALPGRWSSVRVGANRACGVRRDGTVACAAISTDSEGIDQFGEFVPIRI